jgi:peptidoglycan/LPS O-acetylase OafA/YrhL
LNYEFLFYVVFLLSLVTGARHIFLMLSVYLIGLFIVGISVDGHSVIGAFVGNPIMFEFLFGAGIAILYKQNLLPKGMAWVSLVSGIVLLMAFSPWPNESVYRVFLRGLPCLLIFTGVLLLDERITWPRWLVFLGDASYSIYLFHIIFLYQVSGRVLAFLAAHGFVAGSAELAAFVAIGLSVAAGCIVHVFFEVPVTRYLHGALGSNRLLAHT